MDRQNRGLKIPFWLSPNPLAAFILNTMKIKGTIPRVEIINGELVIKMSATELADLVNLNDSNGYRVFDPESALQSFADKLVSFSEEGEDDEDGDNHEYTGVTSLQDAFEQVADACYIDSEPGFAENGDDEDMDSEEPEDDNE